MRKYFIILSLAINFSAFAQTNVFPSDGNVGIGTTTPIVKLEVNGNFKTTGNEAGLRFSSRESDDNDYQWYSQEGKARLYDHNDNIDRIVVSANGNIGIGTTAPTAKLTVDPNGAGGITIGNSSTGTGGYTSLMMNISANQNGYASIMSIKASGAELGVLSLNPTGGNVGIGTTTPNEKLAVNGKIRAKEIKVENANWPDYVFKENYKLKPLSEIEVYIKQHQHLEDVPSATTVAKEGVELGTNQAVLLKKIEELTLHLIEMEKINKAQNEKMCGQIQLLQNEIKNLKTRNN